MQGQGKFVFLSEAVHDVLVLGRQLRVEGHHPRVGLGQFVVEPFQLVTLGVLGEYLWRTLDETKRRPSYLIDRDGTIRDRHVGFAAGDPCQWRVRSSPEPAVASMDPGWGLRWSRRPCCR